MTTPTLQMEPNEKDTESASTSQLLEQATHAARPRFAHHKSMKALLLQGAPFYLVHVVALGAFAFEIQPWMIALAVGSYYFRMFGITAGYHRFFSHRSFQTSRVFQFVLAWIASCSTQKGVLWWAAHHRRHHRYSDTERDIHSPTRQGFWWSHAGWILSDQYEATETREIPDLMKFPELIWLNRFHLVPAITYAVTLGIVGAAFGNFWAGIFWGYLLSTVVLWHGTFTINSLSHVFGWQRYRSKDTSRNNPLLALLTLGEGWHNNHHTYQSSVRQGFFWYEIDMTYLILKALSGLGIVWELRAPPLAQLEARRVRK